MLTLRSTWSPLVYLCPFTPGDQSNSYKASQPNAITVMIYIFFYVFCFVMTPFANTCIQNVASPNGGLCRLLYRRIRTFCKYWVPVGPAGVGTEITKSRDQRNHTNCCNLTNWEETGLIFAAPVEITPNVGLIAKRDTTFCTIIQ